MLDKYESDCLHDISRFSEMIYNEQKQTNILLKQLLEEQKNTSNILDEFYDVWKVLNVED